MTIQFYGYNSILWNINVGEGQLGFKFGLSISLMGRLSQTLMDQGFGLKAKRTYGLNLGLLCSN